MPELKGTINHILDPESGESKAGHPWIKQSFVITYGEEIERDACFSLFGEKKVSLLDNAGVGDYVSVTFNPESRQGKSEASAGKWFTELNAWKLEVISKAHRPAQPSYSAPAPAPAPAPASQTPAPAAAAEKPAAAKPKASAAAQPSETFETAAEDDSLPF